jgi:hypothetical protein
VARKVSFGRCIERCLNKRPNARIDQSLGVCLPKCKKRVRTRAERVAFKNLEGILFEALSYFVGERQARLFSGVEATEIPELEVDDG